MQGEVNSAPTYLAAIFLLPNLIVLHIDILFIVGAFSFMSKNIIIKANVREHFTDFF